MNKNLEPNYRDDMDPLPSLTDLCHCWYSKTQEQERGCTYYIINGKEAKVTNACGEKYFGRVGAVEYNAADSIYLGMGTFSCFDDSDKGKQYRMEVSKAFASNDGTLEGAYLACLEGVELLKKLETGYREN